MKSRIQERLRELEDEHGFRILYACESGSRAWGFASEDSDYDIRFIYVWPQVQYLGIFDPSAMIDLGVDEEDLDITGWDLRKALSLFRKANGSLMEWLHSPIVYLEDSEVMKEWREMVSDYFLPKNSAGHYVGLSRKIWGRISEKGEVTAKKYLYVLRSLLSAKYVVENQMVAPVAFDELRDRVEVAERVSEKISGMIAEKALGRESDVISRDPVLDAFIKEELLQVDAEISKLSSSLGSVEALDRFFRRVIENA